ATHGGSIHHTSLREWVEAMRVVSADGEVVELDRSSDAFPAAGVSLGLLGVVSTVTFRCVPSFVLRSSSGVRSVGDVIEGFDELNRDNLYTDMLYFPATDQVEVLSINEAEGATVAAPKNERRRSRSSGRLRGIGLEAFVWLV